MDKTALNEFKYVAEWVAYETQKRKYPVEELTKLSKSLKYLRNYLQDVK